MYQGGGARCLAGIMAQRCATCASWDALNIVQLVEQWHRVSDVALYHGTGCQVACGIKPPTPGVLFLKPWGGYGGVTLTQEVPNSEAGDPPRAHVGMHQVGYDWRSPGPRCRAEAWERADVASSPTSAQIGHKPPACPHLAKCARPLTPSPPQPN